MTMTNAEEEARVLGQVGERLVARFPNLPSQRVSAAVAESYHHFDAARVRDFVEILTERDAAELLTKSS